MQLIGYQCSAWNISSASVLRRTICSFPSTCTVYFIVSYALQVSFVLGRLIGIRLGGYTDFWIAGVRLGDIYKFHTMGALDPEICSLGLTLFNTN